MDCHAEDTENEEEEADIIIRMIMYTLNLLHSYPSPPAIKSHVCPHSAAFNFRLNCREGMAQRSQLIYKGLNIFLITNLNSTSV
jgi:hypothetical protein